MLLIRDARLDDIPAIEEMVDDFVKGHPAETHPRSADALRRAYVGERPVAHLLVAERDGDIVGMGQWWLGHDMFWGMFFVEAGWLYVRPRCRGSGDNHTEARHCVASGKSAVGRSRAADP